jgi:dynein heavy chain
MLTVMLTVILFRLTSITEQLKSKSVKSVIAILTSASRYTENDAYVDFQRVTSLLSQWREIDILITEAANEAKDNVKYLTTIERFFEPLYGNDPAQIIDTLPALINGIKMIHTIARYYGTTDRVTKLFMKITNQMIATCKLSINGKDSPDKIWDKDLPSLLETIEKCLQLNEQYQEHYRITKEKLILNPKGRQFDFSETQIFSKFDLFCRRLIKLMDMFSTVQQFKSLEQNTFEGLDPLIDAFKEVVIDFRGKRHDLLDYQINRFDRDYVDFNIRMNELELTLQQFINRSFENINSIEQSLNLLRSYQSILHRENLRADLDSKLSIIFNNYGQELIEIEQIYEKCKHNPPIARNMPPVAGNITWARHLLRKIEDPMVKFQDNVAILSTKESKQIIRAYNKVARTLIAFEYLWYEAWCGSIEAAKAGLQATLIIRHEKTDRLYVNFDPEIFQLLREAKCLVKLNIAIPESAKLILLQEELFKVYFNDLKFMLAEYERITNRIIPVTTKLLSPYLKTLELKLRPGLVSLTWTSLNIDQYKASIYAGLKRLEEMVVKINDIVENRVQKNLKQISRTVLVSLPNERAVTLDEFVVMQELSVKSSTHQLSMRNLEVEHAVEDLISTIHTSEVDVSISSITAKDIEEVHEHFSHMTYQAFLNCVKTSLNLVKKKTCYRIGSVKLEPFFEVDVQLSVPSVRLSPTLDEIQSAINLSAVAVFGCMKKMFQWRQMHIPEKDRATYFDLMGKDIEIIKVVLLLTGAMHGTRNIVQEYLRSFRKYDWLWKDDKELAYKHFVRTNPNINDLESELIKFLALEKEISSIASIRVIGALKLNTSNIKHQLTTETRVWKVLYSNKVQKLAKDAMSKLYEFLRVMTNKLNIEVQSLDTLRYVMNVLKEVREKESSIEMDVSPILDMYIMLDHYLPGGVVNQEELEQKANMLMAWRKVVEHADSVAQGLSALQGTYKKQLVWDIREFSLDIRAFRTDFDDNGPMITGIKPAIALDKLRKYKDELASRERKMEMYKAGEELFALRPTRFADLIKIRKDVNLLDQLYSIYTDVHQSVKQWSNVLWGNVADQIASITEVVNGYEARCKKLPKKLREWQAYDDVCTKIADLQALQPLLVGLCKPSIKPRHWIEINNLLAPTKTTLPYQDEEFSMAYILNSAIVQFKEEVEELCEGADKQLQIERRMLELKEYWAVASFEFAIWKNRDIPVLKAFGFVIEELEEAQLQLQSLLSIRHVTPFKDDVHKFLTSLSDTADTLEMWVKVQLLWTSLESVFLGGDIAKQMPMEAKKFSKINKDWEKLMVRAAEVKLVVASCSNELLRTTLPVLYSELEKCQKSLEGYLEQKRSKFPR